MRDVKICLENKDKILSEREALEKRIFSLENDIKLIEEEYSSNTSHLHSTSTAKRGRQSVGSDIDCTAVDKRTRL